MPEPISLLGALLGAKIAMTSGGAAGTAAVGGAAAGATVATTAAVGVIGGAAIMCKTCRAVKYGNEAYKCREKYHRLEREY